MSTERGGFDRREILKLLATTPVIAALGCSGEQMARAARAAGQDGSKAPQFFMAHEWETVRLLADLVLPADTRSESATDAKVPEFMDYLLAEDSASETFRIAMRGGLAWLDTECRRRVHRSFVDADDAARRHLLDDIAWPDTAKPEFAPGVAFFTRFRDLTAAGFFSSAIGWKDLDYRGNVAVGEWTGCPQAALDKLHVSHDLMTTRIRPAP